MDKVSRQKFYYLTAALVALVIVFALYIHFEYPFGGDQALSSPNVLEQVYLSLFAWQQLNYSGLINILGSVPGILFGLLLLIPYKLSIILGSILSYVLFSFIGLAGMFYLVYELTSTYPHKIRYFSSILASIMFSFPFFSHLNSPTTPIVSFLPLVFLFTKRLFYNKNNKTSIGKLNLFGLIVSVAFFFSMGGSGFVVLNFIVLAVLAMLTLFFAGRNNLVRNAKYIFAVFALSMLINMSWLITTYTFTRHVASGFFVGSIGTLNVFATNLIQTLFSFGPWPFSVNIYTALILLGILVISLSSYAYVKSDDKNRGIIASILFIYLFMVGLATTIYAPFGVVFSNLLKVFPYLLTLRYTYTAMHYVFLFLVSTLFGLCIAYIMHELSKKKNKRLLIAFLALLSVIVGSYLYLFDYVPISAPSISAGIPQYVNIPQHVFQISDYVNSQKGMFAVAAMPIDPNWQVESWYVSVNVYSSLIGKPVYTGGYSYYNEIFFPNTEGEYDSVAQSIENSNLTGASISNMLGVFGIRYVVVQGDALNYSQCKGYCLITPFKWIDIYNNFNTSKNIALAGRYGNSSVYENSNYVPLVYATNIDNIGSSTAVFSTIGSKTFNIHNDSVYSESNYGLFNASGKINATSIENFSQPVITFSQDTPTHITVHVSNATTPYYLVLRETYDPYWQAYYSNGTAIPSNDHIAVNGFANAWYMNKTGNYTLTLYYTPQTIAWAAWGVSFAAFFATIGIGVYGWKEEHGKGASKSRNWVQR